MGIDDATNFIVDFIRNPRNDGYGSYGYEIYLPSVITAYIIEVEHSTEHRSSIYNGPHAANLSPTFFEAAWDLCRRGILRPGILRLGGQGTAEGASGYGYSVTALGRRWIQENSTDLFLSDTGRLSQLFERLSAQFGTGFLQRANEAARCYQFCSYLACCAMCGAAVESVLLAVAIEKLESEEKVLTIYRAAQGRKKLVDAVVGKARQSISGPFATGAGLLAYWRDEAAHGLASTITEIEAHEALGRLIRFAQFSSDNWLSLTGT
ncbi:MAG TPA: hypothetical protein VIM56_00505 [Rhizomicrobium sp.]